MNRFEKIALVAVILVTWLLAGATWGAWKILVVRQHLPVPLTALAITGWILANYVPIGIALALSRLAKRSRRPWMFHLLLLPAIWLTMWLGGLIILETTGLIDFDLLIGAPIMPGMYLLPVAVFGYFAAVLTTIRPPRDKSADPSRQPLVDVAHRQD